jgi:hypothetical protein
METQDQRLIEELIKINAELAQLWHDHLDFEARLEEMNRRLYLTPEEQLERKALQKRKLAGRDRIEAIVAAHRAEYN